MNVFLTSTDPFESFIILDNRRLNKQKVELKQIYTAFNGGGWRSHPATLMMKSSPEYTAYLGYVCTKICLDRGFNDSLMPFFMERFDHNSKPKAPAWMVDGCDFFEDVKANLIRKLPSYYKQIWPNVEPKLGYRWPVEG